MKHIIVDERDELISLKALVITFEKLISKKQVYHSNNAHFARICFSSDRQQTYIASTTVHAAYLERVK